MDKKNIILIPIDFSEESIVAIKYAKLTAPMFNANIHLIHVIESKNPILQLISDDDKSIIREKIIKKINTIIKDYLSEDIINTSFSIENGNLIESILKTQRALDAKLIIVGTTGSKDIRKKIIGSNALRIIREAECPVISIKSKNSIKSITKIVLPLDTSKVTTQKVEHGIFFAKYFTAKVHLVSVETGDNFIESDTAIQQLEATANHFSKQDIPCTIKLLKAPTSSSKMAKVILEYTYKQQANLIMIMTSEESGKKQFDVGSLAKEIIHKANIPVFSITPKPMF